MSLADDNNDMELWLHVPTKWIQEPSCHGNRLLVLLIFAHFAHFAPSFFFCGESRAKEGLYFQFIFAIQVASYPNWGAGYQEWKESCCLLDKLWLVSCSLSSPSISRLVSLWKGLPYQHNIHIDLYGSKPGLSSAGGHVYDAIYYVVSLFYRY